MDFEVDIHSLITQVENFQKRYSKIEKKLLKKHHLNKSEIELMQLLSENPLTLKDLTTQSPLNKSTLSRQLKSLLEKNRILKQTGQDRRFAYFTLPEESATIVNSFLFEKEKLFSKIFQSWPMDEKQLLLVLLGRVNRSMESVEKNWERL